MLLPGRKTDDESKWDIEYKEKEKMGERKEKEERERERESRGYHERESAKVTEEELSKTHLPALPFFCPSLRYVLPLFGTVVSLPPSLRTAAFN